MDKSTTSYVMKKAGTNCGTEHDDNSIIHKSDSNVNSFTDKATTTSNVIKAENGTEHDDYIIGSESNDTIFGYRGNDIIQALGGDDTVYGGDRNNQLFGEAGRDSIVGGPFNDLVVGGLGNDRLYGNGGDDILVGGPGADYFDCGDGIDTVIDYTPSQGDIISSNCENVNTLY